MGWKCPICFKDFNRDKNKWKAHIAKEHKGFAKDFVDALKNITKADQQEQGGGE